MERITIFQTTGNTSLEHLIAQGLAREIWNQLFIPLAVRGYSKGSDGMIELAFAYSVR